MFPSDRWRGDVHSPPRLGYGSHHYRGGLGFDDEAPTGKKEILLCFGNF